MSLFAKVVTKINNVYRWVMRSTSELSAILLFTVFSMWDVQLCTIRTPDLVVHFTPMATCLA